MKVSYDQETREAAKRQGKGLVTIEVVTPRGRRTTVQLVADDHVVRYAQHALDHAVKIAGNHV